MFGGSLTLAHQSLSMTQPDVLLFSDMTDVAAFLGHTRGRLGDPRVVLYMHENQLTYPLSPTARDDLAYAYMNWSSMVVADDVWFNSQFHLDSVFAALPSFLRHFPDHRHNDLIDEVRAKSRVMPVGVDIGWVEDGPKDEPPLIVWNQRWEYDKDPSRLFDSLQRLSESDSVFQLAICGENFRNAPEEFDTARERLSKHIIQFGFAERPHYLSLLQRSSIVMSTARHEFFGIAAVEAMAAGAVPVFPRALSYPELTPPETHIHTLFENDDELDERLRKLVDDADLRSALRSTIAPSMKRFGWETIGPEYDSELAGPGSR